MGAMTNPAAGLVIEDTHFLKWNGNPISLYGVSNFWITGDPDVVITTLFDEFQSHSSNLHRCSLLSHVVGKRAGLSQTDVIYPFARSATAGANDGGNKFDLTQLNSTYFTRLGTIASESHARDIIQLLIMWDEIPFESGLARWAYNPFSDDNNTNTTGLDAADAVSTAGKQYWKDAAGSDTTLRLAQELVFDAVLDEFAPYGNLLVAISNEYTGTDAWSEGWHDRVVAYNAANGTNLLTVGMLYNTRTPDYDPTWTDVWSPDTWDAATFLKSWKTLVPVVSHKIPGDEDWLTNVDTARAHWWNSFIYGAAGEGDDSQDGDAPPMQWTEAGSAAALDEIANFHSIVNTVPFNILYPEDATTVIGTLKPWRYAADSVYVGFFESGGSDTTDLSATTGTYSVTWYDAENSANQTESNRSSMGATESFTSPYSTNDAVLVLRKQ